MGMVNKFGQTVHATMVSGSEAESMVLAPILTRMGIVTLVNGLETRSMGRELSNMIVALHMSETGWRTRNKGKGGTFGRMVLPMKAATIKASSTEKVC